MALKFPGFFMRKGGIAAYKCWQPFTLGGAFESHDGSHIPVSFMRECGIKMLAPIHARWCSCKPNASHIPRFFY